MIYMDSASTAKYRPTIDNNIVNTIADAMMALWQNPSSLYSEYVKEEINKCRIGIAEFIGAEPEEITFTSGASESNNMAIRGWVDHMLMNTLQFINVITTPIEHKSILGAVKNGALGARVYHCDVNEYGFVDYKSLEYLLLMCKEEPVLVSIHLANNEIGTIQDIKKISSLVHKYGGVLHVDATQAFGHIPINVEDLDVDMLSASGHKISPVLKGIGFLYKKNCIKIRPLIYGTQENGLRGGTENTFGIIGLARAIKYCNTTTEMMDLENKRDYFINMLCSKFKCKLNGHSEYRLPNNINVTFPQNITGEALLYILDLNNIKISVGSACNSHSIEPSFVLKEIGLSDEEAMKTVRFTLPEDITYEDIDYVINEIERSIKLIET